MSLISRTFMDIALHQSVFPTGMVKVAEWRSVGRYKIYTVWNTLFTLIYRIA